MQVILVLFDYVFLYFVDLCVFFFFYVLFMLPPQFLICHCSMNNGIAYVDGDDGGDDKGLGSCVGNVPYAG